jgi:outer membrane protein assembly factor BamB
MPDNYVGSEAVQYRKHWEGKNGADADRLTAHCFDILRDRGFNALGEWSTPQLWNRGWPFTVLIHVRQARQNQEGRGTAMSMRWLGALVLGMLVTAWDVPAASEGGHAADAARHILTESNIRTGVIVHLGCGDGKLTVELANGNQALVQGLDRDATRVQAARDQISRKGLYSRVTIQQWNGDSLPYVDNLVTLLIADDAGGVAEAEMMRVLSPLGVLLVKRNGQWTRVVKPWPKEIDEWTHSLHDADGNPVAKDHLAGPPRSLQWVGTPVWSRSHGLVPSVTALVSAQGRLFYICDEAPPNLDPEFAPDQWSLIARDAFNGALLWKLPMPNWGWRAWSGNRGPKDGRWNLPANIGARLVARGDRVYATRGFNDPVSEIDAATGKVLRIFAGTEHTDEILCYENKLILSVNRKPLAPSALETGKKTHPVAAAGPPSKFMAVIDLSSGKSLWQSGNFAGLRPMTGSMELITQLIAVAGDAKIFLAANREDLICLDLATGDERWRIQRPKVPAVANRAFVRLTDRCSLMYHDGVVLFAQPDPQNVKDIWRQGTRTQIVAYSADDGKQLWTQTGSGWGIWEAPDIFVIHGKVWIHDFGKFELVQLELKTGKELRRLDTTGGLKEEHHHRCMRNRSTEGYIMTARRGVELYRLSDGNLSFNRWTRSTCNLGYFPCNGLLYILPHSCRCYLADKMNGLLAYSSRANSALEKAALAPQLVRGPAYGKPVVADGAAGEWPAWRHDGERSGSTTTRIPAELRTLWTVRVPGEPTAAVVAGNTILVGTKKSQTLHALDAMSGKELWTHLTGGPLDLPPAICDGLALTAGRDGWLDCVRAKDGELVYRLRGAPAAQQILADGRLESSWPSYGVLVHNGRAYFTAGRSPRLDGGMFAFGIDPATGEIKESKRLQDVAALPDALVAAGGAVLMKSTVLFGQGHAKTEALRSEDTLINPQWFNATEWIYGNRVVGQNAVFDPERVYSAGVRELPASCGGVSYGMEQYRFAPGQKGYHLAALTRSGWKRAWQVMVKVRPLAMAVTPDALLVAGSPDVVPKDDPLGAIQGRKGGVLLVISPQDGGTLAEYTLPSPPVPDGITVVPGRVIVCLTNSEVSCFGE